MAAGYDSYLFVVDSYHMSQQQIVQICRRVTFGNVKTTMHVIVEMPNPQRSANPHCELGFQHAKKMGLEISLLTTILVNFDLRGQIMITRITIQSLYSYSVIQINSVIL